MPNWLVEILTILLGLASAMTIWALVQSVLNYRAVRLIPDLRRFAWNVIWQQAALSLAVVGLAFVGVISLVFEPRPSWARIVSNSLLVVVVLALTWASYHQYRVMRQQLTEEL